MTVGILGAILLVLLGWTYWRGGSSLTIAFTALLLGFIVAGSDGPVHDVVSGTIHGIQHVANTVAKAL